MKSKEGHASLLDWWPLATCVIVVVAPWIAACLPAEISAWNSLIQLLAVHARLISGLGVFGFLGLMLWHSFEIWDDLNEARKVRVEIACSKEVPGCRMPTSWPGIGGNVVFRVEVKTPPEVLATGCYGEIIKITRGQRDLWVGNNLKLTFAPSEEPDWNCKTIPEGTERYLDVIFVRHNIAGMVNGWAMGTKNHTWPDPQLPSIFSENGDYTFTLRLMADKMKPKSFRVIFHLSSSINECEMSLLDSPNT